MTSLKPHAVTPTSDSYKVEYQPSFVEKWDELIDWEGRAQGEGSFFVDLLQEAGCERVLDAASGTGFHAVNLAREGFEVVAADGADTMLRKTEQNMREYDVEFPTYQADWRSLDEDVPGRFDALVCLGNAFTHLFDLEDRKRTLEQFHQVLEPGGLAVIDQRNYDAILNQGYSSKHRYYYTGKGVEAAPEEITDEYVRFRYAFPDGAVHHLTLYPVMADELTKMMLDVGFDDVERYGAGPADEIYRLLWGDNVHMGTWEVDGESLQDAMARTSQVMADRAGVDAHSRVLDVGCGYGAAAIGLAAERDCEVVGINISEKELEQATRRAKELGLDDRAEFRWGDFHDIPADDDRFDVVWSQEAFLHGVDKPRILRECRRVLRPGGRLVVSDLLVDASVPDDEREAIYARVHSPEMWDHDQYVAGLDAAGFEVTAAEDWSANVAPTYTAVREGLVARRGELEGRVPEEQLDSTVDALQLWIDSANANKIAQGFFVAVAP